MPRHECIQRLDDLPIFSNDDNKSFDGLDYGCRALHSVFAWKNPDHCPHISFEPQEDPKGNIKCQHSKNLQSLDYFNQDEIQDFMDFLESPTSLIESTYGYKVLDMPREDINPKRIVILFGIVTPVVLFIFVYTLQRLTKNKENAHNEATSSDKKDVNALFSDKARQLSIILWIVVSTLVLVNGLAAVVIWKIGQNHPEWISDNDGGISPEDKFLSEPSTSLAGTVPQTFLDDEQFAIYAGFVVWATCLISGFGLEVFIWYQFLQVWSDEREGLWRFVQFIFPLMLVTALILALHNNALSLPIMVAGLWKFGFPETLMYLYLGKTFTTTASRNYYYHRLSDFLNGIGTVLHHGAASMILSMIVVGVIPPSRYVLNCTLILAMQHWVVLFAYKNLALYSAMEMTLEYFFEWVILSDFSHIYNLHWTAALGAAVMLFSHWIYIIAGVLGSISWYEDNDSALKSSSKNGTENVHTRGQKLMRKDSQEISTRRKRRLLDGTRSPSAWELRNAFSSEMMMVEDNNTTCLVGLMMEEKSIGSSDRTQQSAEDAKQQNFIEAEWSC